MKLTLERQIPLAFIVAILLLATISFISYRNTTSLNEAIKWEKHTQEVLLKLDETLSSIVDAETGARGFLITGNQDFLAPYNQSEQRIEENFKQLRTLFADNPAQMEKVEKVESLVRQRLVLLKSFVEKRRTQSLDSILAQTPMGQGKGMMDEIRRLIGEMKTEETNLLAIRENDLDSSVNRTYKILFIGSIAGMISLGLANLAIFREAAKRRQAEHALKNANTELEFRVEARTQALAKTNDELVDEIKKRHEYEEVLRESEIFTRTILDSLSAHIAVIDKNGEIVTVNEAWENFARQNSADGDYKLTGVGRNYLQVCQSSATYEEDSKFVSENLQAVLDGNKNNFYFEYPCHSPTEERWFILQVNSLQGAKGGAVISHINITDRKKAEILLKNSEEFNRSIFENSPDCVKVLEMDGTLHSMNVNGLYIMEIDDFSSYTGKTWSDFWEDNERQSAIEAIEKARNGETGHFEGFCKTAKGTLKYWDVTVAPVFDVEGKPHRLISTSRDITERNQSAIEREELLKREQIARRDAEIANRLRDEFLATVSHELRAPLNSILGWARLIQQGKVDEKMFSKAIETIVRNADAQNRLIEDLLDVSRIIAGKLRLEVSTVKPGNIVEAALETVRHAADAKNISLAIQEDAEISHISGDPNRLQQVVWNLLSNAIKFTPNDGRVNVAIERKNSHIEIKVSDTGVGIKEEFLPYVFDRFRQADASSIRKFGGLGLGLAIVRHITEMHGGTVQVESAGENHGSTFTVILPLIPLLSDKENIGEKSKSDLLETDAKLRLDGLLILVVDDEEDTRQLMVQALTHYGATVTTAASAEEALNEMKGKNPDVLVSDIGMPDEDGYSLIKKVRALNINIPAIALTAFTRAQDRVRAISSGFQNHVSKPVEPNELATVIASLTERLPIANAE